MDANTELRVRARAYLLWEQDGCPLDRAIQYWLRAEQEVLAEEADGGHVLRLQVRNSRRPERAKRAIRQLAAL